jgi:hypothetical protein
LELDNQLGACISAAVAKFPMDFLRSLATASKNYFESNLRYSQSNQLKVDFSSLLLHFLSLSVLLLCSSSKQIKKKTVFAVQTAEDLAVTRSVQC